MEKQAYRAEAIGIFETMCSTTPPFVEQIFDG